MAKKEKGKKAKVREAAPPEKEEKKGKKATPDIIIKDKFVKRTVAGLVFWPGDKVKFFTGMLAWREAGMPDGAYIYDSLDNLVTCGVPLSDVTMIRGLAVRRAPRKPKTVRVNIAYATAKTSPPEVKKSVKGIFDANTKTHHSLSYG